MGFFNLLETVFFISLAITFVLIMMLVYHFKGRLIILEQKCDTMFEILNNMIKEMKNMQSKMTSHEPVISSTSDPLYREMPSSGKFQIDLLSMLGNQFQHTPMEYLDTIDEMNEPDDTDDDDDDNNVDENEYDSEYKKIVVSDTEYDSENEENEKVKVIHIDIGNDNDNSNNDCVSFHEKVMNEEENEEKEQNEEKEENDEGNNTESLDKPIDYKKMDISYLRTLAISRGLAVDTKRLKKTDLIKLLSEE